MTNLDATYLRKMYKYDPLTGVFTAQFRDAYHWPGKVIVGNRVGAGYLAAWVRGEKHYLHRLAWLYMTGEFPAQGAEVDHINRNKLDNRWENLRVVSASENRHNRGMNGNNTSGVKGVSYHSQRGTWVAEYMNNGKRFRKSFKTQEEAVAARKQFELAI